MDVDNLILLEKYFSTHNSPYEKKSRRSTHIKFATENNFEKKLISIYNESGTNNVPAIYNLLFENFQTVEMQLSHSEKYSHIYVACVGDYDIEGSQVHFMHPKPRVNLYEQNKLNKWCSLAIFKKGTSTTLFRI